ncbi:hypothetical protein FGIG_06023 [Fasciola gigantica]|uniref:Uncharacterized protein n=1 Tax=Fasciola gigantica TaxID=46835 RepID=A0A504YG55_FASGI|nr:hypothetical protein FGIG_06023 [Fasciola gigantica]
MPKRIFAFFVQLMIRKTCALPVWMMRSTRSSRIYSPI